MPRWRCVLHGSYFDSFEDGYLMFHDKTETTDLATIRAALCWLFCGEKDVIVDISKVGAN